MEIAKGAVELIAAGVFTISFVNLIFADGHYRSFADWGGTSVMARPTAVCFMGLSIGLFIISWMIGKRCREGCPKV